MAKKSIKIDWGRFAVERINPVDLTPHPLNHRIHNKRQKDVLLGLLRRLGWTVPILVSRKSGYIVEGHARRDLAIENGVEAVPVIYLDLTEQQELEVLLSHDKVSSLAAIDQELLGQAFVELGQNYDLVSIGYDVPEIEMITSGNVEQTFSEPAKKAKKSAKAAGNDQDGVIIALKDPSLAMVIREAFEHWGERSETRPTMEGFILDLCRRYLEENK